MNKKIIMCIIASAMLCGSIVSCGKSDSSDSKKQEKTTTATTTVAETTSADTTETETTSAEADAETTTSEGGDSDAAADHLRDAYIMINNLDTIDRIGGGAAVETAATDTKEDGTYMYSKVIDARFPDLEAVKAFVNDAVCGTLVDRYKFLYEGDAAYFKEFDGILYFIQTGRGCGFSYNSDPVISDVTDDSFTVDVNFDDFGGNSALTVKAVKENDTWKASSFKVNGGEENAR